MECQRSGKIVMDNKGMGVVEIILVLTILIILVLTFRDRLVETMAWSYRRFLEDR